LLRIYDYLKPTFYKKVKTLKYRRNYNWGSNGE